MKLPEGFLLSSLNCGLRVKRPDLGLIYCSEPAAACAFFTTNANVSYSVTCAKKVSGNPIGAVLVNSGNANCFSHQTGDRDTAKLAADAAGSLGLKPENLFIASTGIIGKKMPFGRIAAAVPALKKGLGSNIGGFARAIMTTDKYPKVSAVALPGGATILGIAKGAGMISPKMATMLAFIMTDVAIAKPLLKKISRRALEESFNAISVDGCMSTNDTLLILSSGKKKLSTARGLQAFTGGLKKVSLELAKMMVADGEGATKMIEIFVKGAQSTEQAKKAAVAIANSNLFKCAIYGEDANWGRIIAAIGQVGVAVGRNVKIAASDLKKNEVTITVDLKLGRAQWRFYTSDLTPEYIKINAEYN